MTCARATQRNSLGFRIFTILFFFLLVVALALGGQVVYAERTQAPSRLTSAIDQPQMYKLAGFWHFQSSQPTLQLPIQIKNIQNSISIQNPRLLKVIL
jgi:hypothetical protein